MNDLLQGFSKVSTEKASLLDGFESAPKLSPDKTVSKEQELLSGFSKLTQEGPETVGSTVERTVEEEKPGDASFTGIIKSMGADVLSAGKELGSDYLDLQKENFKTLFSLGGPAKVALGGLETIGNFGAGALSWAPSKIGLAVQTGIGKALQLDDKLRKTPELNLSDADVARGAEKVEKIIGNVLPSIIGESKTELGARQTKFLGDIFDTALTPLKTASAFYKEQGWPNFGNMVALTGEMLVFKTLHKYTPEMVDIGKRFIKADGKKGQAKVRAEKKLEEKQAALLKKINDDAKNGELQDIIKERMTKNQQLIAGAEGFSAIDIPKPPGAEPVLPTLSELSQRGKGFEGEVVKPDLGSEPVSGLKTETVTSASLPQARVEFISEEGIPRATYQIENGKIKEVEKIGEQKSYQINPETKTIELVENVPGQKSVYQILLDPLKNENGFIEIPTSRKKLLESTTPAFRENVRRFGELAEKSGKSMIEFLKDNDFSKKEIDKMLKVAETVKLESPFKAPKIDVVISEGKDPLRSQPGEVNINTGPKANPKTFIGDKFFEGIKNIKENKIPPILQAVTPTIHFIKNLKSPEMLDLWHKTKAIEGNRLKDVKILKDTVGGLREQYPKRKLREEAFIKIMSQDMLGREALTMLDIKPIDGPIKYEGLVGELQGQFKDLFNQLNTMRSSIGKSKIAERQSYLPMIAQENFYSQMKQLFKGQEGEINHPNMVLDSVQAVNTRHSPEAVQATALRHLKRRGLRQGIKLETDPLRLLAQYGNTAYKHIHYSPFNMFVNQLTTGKFKVKNSKGIDFDWTMANQKPELHEFLSRWSNALAGKPNLMHGPALRFLEQGAQKLSSNLTAAVLGWSARTVLVQPTALLPTVTEFGVTPTVKGLMRTAMRSKKDPIARSQELPTRIADASMTRDITNQLKNPVMRTLSLPAEKALSGMKFVDYVVAEATWRTAFNASKHLGESAAIRLADEAVVRSQGSGFVGDLSPIQMNALGKAVTLWQTFTINNMNWVGREVLGITHPERNPAETARRAATYVIGTALINTLFEDELGIQSPQPAPIKEMIRAAQNGDSNFAIAYKGLKEMTELAPFLSSLKFGSSPAGAVAEFLKELSEAAANDLPKALNGDKEAIKRVGFVAAKLTGVPGTQQVKRIVNATPLGFPIEKIGKVTGKRTKRVRTKTTRTRRKR